MDTIKRAFTHGGRFHADDVFSFALLSYMFPEIEIERGYVVPENFDGIVFDIGFGEFDHHQENKKVRSNGVAYAAFGLLWEKYGASIVGEEEAAYFDEKFIQPLDICDNTGEYSELATIIGLFNPAWDSNEDENEAFFKAVAFAKNILIMKFEKIKSIARAKDLVERAMENQKDGIMILETGAPWKQFVKNSEIEFVISPSQRGGYNAQGVEKGEEDRELKYPFPVAWRGKTVEELPKISGIDTLRFCHNSGFLVATMTLDDAILACKLTKSLQNLT